MITLLVFAVGLALVLGLGFSILGLSAKHAPDGYEDEAGFHFGREPEDWREHFLISTFDESPDDGGHGAVHSAYLQRQGPRAAWPSVGLR